MGGELPGVRYVRDNADGLALAAAMETAKKAAVVGGGYIGLEVAASCATRGLKPEVIMMEPHVMGRLWNADIAEALRGVVRSGGATFHRSSKVKDIVAGADGAARGVRLESGETIDADLVVVGIGATAPVPFEGLDAPEGRVGGVKVDARFRASGPLVEPGSVYAIGDIAAFPLKLTGETVRLEHVKHARDSAAYVGDLIAGKLRRSTIDALLLQPRLSNIRHRTRRQLGLLRRSNRRRDHHDRRFKPKTRRILDRRRQVRRRHARAAPPRRRPAFAARSFGKSIDVAALRAAASVDDAVAMIL